MPPFKSLRRRIVVAYLLFAAVASLFFAIIAAVAVEGIEVKLVDERLEEVAAWASPRQAGGLPVEMPAGLSFYHDAEIPQSLRGLPQGANEITVDGVDLHVLAGRDPSGDYVVVDHASAYEKIELVVYSMFAVGFAGFLVSSLMFGAFIGNSVVRPIMDLATAVQARRTDLPQQDNPDELGILARAFAARTTELTEVLDRERFFTGDVSHELRTPLMVLASSCELLLVNPNIDTRARSQVERIARATEEMQELVKTFLMLARAQRDEGAVASQASMKEVADDLIGVWRDTIEQKGLTLLYDAKAATPTLYNATFLQAVMGNLLRNAAHYTDQGFIRLTLEPAGFLVEDSGVGIPEEQREAMFRPFVRGDEKRGEGLGLGLSLVQRICDDQGWSVSLTAMVPHGCRFHVDLSLALQRPTELE